MAIRYFISTAIGGAFLGTLVFNDVTSDEGLYARCAVTVVAVIGGAKLGALICYLVGRSVGLDETWLTRK